uniref:Uncharacterized protein n=1 Tax=viral metagenome TaxID=1070528 RepID=A0A6M3K467_9ZZZZ
MAKLKITSDGTLSGTVITEIVTGAIIENIRIIELNRDPQNPDILVALLRLRRPALEINNIEFAQRDD